LNIANPSSGLQKSVEIDDDKKLLPFFEKRMGAEVLGDSLGEEFKGYLFRITGGNDKQGFPMMQGVLSPNRVRLLFKDGMPCFRLRRRGQAKRKSVRGCIVGPDLSVLSLVVAKKGDADIPGLTDGEKPRRLGPKRAGKIRKMFNLTKDDDVRRFVIRRQVSAKKTKSPKIQRLVTPVRLQRKRAVAAVKRDRIEVAKKEKSDYEALLDAYRSSKAKTAEPSAAKKGSKPTAATTATKTAPTANAAATRVKKGAADAGKAAAGKSAAPAAKTAVKGGDVKMAATASAPPAAAKGKAVKPAAKSEVKAAQPKAAGKAAEAKPAAVKKDGKGGKK